MVDLAEAFREISESLGLTDEEVALMESVWRANRAEEARHQELEIDPH